ncbi:MAG: methyltransferase domain-containing protein [Thermonemataceae bacterium]|nr:methyltransferase domain-containing protein [Thermonemataceae bacterium]
MYKKIITVVFFLSKLTLMNAQHHHGKANTYMNQSDFDKLVQRFENSERDSWQKPEKVLAFMGDMKEKTVVDIGAGTGYFAFRLASVAKNIIAADVDERFSVYIQNKNKEKQFSNISTRKAEYEKPPIQDAEADVVLMVNVYHHIEHRGVYFKELLEKLKSDGELVIIDFKKGDLPQGPPNKMKLSEKQVVKELKKIGFQVDKIDTETLPYQYMIKVKK